MASRAGHRSLAEGADALAQDRHLHRREAVNSGAGQPPRCASGSAATSFWEVTRAFCSTDIPAQVAVDRAATCAALSPSAYVAVMQATRTGLKAARSVALLARHWAWSPQWQHSA